MKNTTKQLYRSKCKLNVDWSNEKLENIALFAIIGTQSPPAMTIIIIIRSMPTERENFNIQALYWLLYVICVLVFTSVNKRISQYDMTEKWIIIAVQTMDSRVENILKKTWTGFSKCAPAKSFLLATDTKRWISEMCERSKVQRLGRRSILSNTWQNFGCAIFPSGQRKYAACVHELGIEPSACWSPGHWISCWACAYLSASYGWMKLGVPDHLQNSEDYSQFKWIDFINLQQESPNYVPRAKSGPWSHFIRPAKAFCQ